MALGTLGHAIGTFTLMEIGSGIFVWSLSGTLAAALIIAINILRHKRKNDQAVSLISMMSAIGWLGIVLLFGQSIGNVLDLRVLMHAFAAVGLAFFSYKSIKA